MQMTMTYAGSPLVGEALAATDSLANGPRPGDRAPDVSGLRRFGVGHPLRLFDLTRGTAHTLVVYADATSPADTFDECDKLAAMVRDRAPELVNVYLVASPDTTVPSGLAHQVLRDTDGAFRAAYGLAGAGAYLIRPDGHVGFRCSPLDAAALDDHLAGIVA